METSTGPVQPQVQGSSTAGSPVARRRPALWLILLLAAVLGAGFWWWQGQNTRRVAGLHAARGVELREAGKLDNAIREFERAAKLDPGNAYAWYLLGKSQEERQRGDGLPAYARALRQRPETPGLLRDYGLALHEAGKIEDARSLLTRGVRLNPTDQAAYAALGRNYLGRVTGKADLDEGVSALRTALTLQPGDIQSRFRLARALYQADKLDAARREYETALALLAQGGRAAPGLMDGRSPDSVAWLSIVKGCHHYLSQIAARQRKPAAAARHRRLFDEMGRYIQETYPLFTRLKENPQDSKAKAALAALYTRFGLPAAGPDGRSAARRWIPG
jgi:tetratricopeptide (TPR) repeat protein